MHKVIFKISRTLLTKTASIYETILNAIFEFDCLIYAQTITLNKKANYETTVKIQK